MGRYSYEARDDIGHLDTGVLTASTAEEASQFLRREGKTVLTVQEEQADLAHLTRAHAPKARVKRDDIIFFANQLAVMVDTGVPLTEALDSIIAQTDHTGMKALVENIAAQIKSGVEFSTALEKYPKLFDSLFIALMRASEASGTMGLMLQRLSDYMTADRETRKKVKGAMTYPICMLVFCVTVIFGLMVFILPRFEKIYAGKGAALPVPTRVLMGISHAMVSYWPLFLGAIVAAVAGGWFYFRSPSGRNALDKLKLSVPILGGMYRKACLARSMRTMATMVKSGVSMLDGLDITAHASGNRVFAKVWHDLADGIAEGTSLSDQLFLCPLVPRTITQMISAGEKTGRLGDVMDRVAKFCEDDLSAAVKGLTQLIEPVMIVVMGSLVGGIAIALLLPVFKISRVVAR
jgi:type IV pilus assembly protein PilC